MDSELQDSEKCPSNSAKRGGERDGDFWGIEGSRETEEGFEASRVSRETRIVCLKSSFSNSNKPVFQPANMFDD